jgi:hypothetical protein
MDWVHFQASENKLVCPDCGLDFRVDPPRANLLNEDNEDDAKVVSVYRFYGVDGDGWLVGDATIDYRIDNWVMSRNIDITKPHGHRPTPDAVEREFRHGPFYITQNIVDSIR